MIGLVKIEKKNLNCLYENPSLTYKYDQPYFISSIGNDLLHTIKLLYESDVKVNISNLVAYGNSRNRDITEGNLLELRSEEYDLGEFDFYFTALKKEFAKNQIQNVLLSDTLEMTSSKGELDTHKIESLILSMQSHLDIISGKESALQTLDQVALKYRGVLQARRKGEYHFETGDSMLDKNLAVGFAPGQITTIFGATGIGKSMFALNLVNRQINKSIPSVYLSLEMDDISTMDRLIAMRQMAPASTFHTNDQGELSQEAFELLDREMETLTHFNKRFFLVTDPSLTVAEFELLVKEAKKRMGVEYLVATLDLLTMLSDLGQKPIEIEETMNRLHIVAKRQNIHIVGVVQANRQMDSARVDSIDQLDKLRPKRLDGIKNSASFGERSRLVLSVFRPKYYAQQLFPDEPETEAMPDTFIVTILKQSNGRSGGLLYYLYDPQCFRLFPYNQQETDLNDIYEEDFDEY